MKKGDVLNFQFVLEGESFLYNGEKYRKTSWDLAEHCNSGIFRRFENHDEVTYEG